MSVSGDPGQALSEMMEALASEVAAIKKKGGSRRIRLLGGEFVGQSGEGWLYRFVISEELNLRDETPIRVTIDRKDVSGILVSFKDGVLLVSLEEDCGPQIASAQLVADDSFLVERLRERLGEVQAGSRASDRHPCTIMNCHGPGEPRLTNHPSPPAHRAARRPHLHVEPRHLVTLHGGNRCPSTLPSR